MKLNELSDDELSILNLYQYLLAENEADYQMDKEYIEKYKEGKDETTITIYGEPTSYNEIQKKLEADGYEDVGGEFTYIPNDTKDVMAREYCNLHGLWKGVIEG